MISVSVIVPVYNVEKYLDECVKSILNQTYTKFELVLVDDGSPDNSGKMCDEYAKKDNRIVVIHKENGGLSDARNVGVEKATGDYICFVDGDDCIHQQTLELLAGGVEKGKASISMCLNLQDQEVPSGFFEEKVVSPIFFDVNENEIIDNDIFSYTKSDMPWVATAKLINKSILLKWPMEKGKHYEDNAVVLRWLYEAKRIAFINEAMYFYRQRSDSIMHLPLTHKSADYLWALEEQIKFTKDVGYNRLLELIYENYLGTSIYMAKRYIKENSDEAFAKQILKKASKIRRQYCIKPANNKSIKFQRDITEMQYPILKKIRKKFRILFGTKNK